MKPYWKKARRYITAVMLTTITALVVTTQTGYAQELEAEANATDMNKIEEEITYYPFTIEDQMNIVQKEQTELAMKNKEEKIEQEKVEQEKIRQEKIKKQKAEEERKRKEAEDKAKREAEAKAKADSQRKKQSTQSKPSNSAPKQSGKSLTVTATAYTANCTGCSGITRTGINLKANPNAKVIAVDPNVIPLGSKVYVPGYGEAIAGDTGGAIKGNKIDLFIPSKSQAINFGRKTITIQILSTP